MRQRPAQSLLYGNHRAEPRRKARQRNRRARRKHQQDEQHRVTPAGHHFHHVAQAHGPLRERGDQSCNLLRAVWWTHRPLLRRYRTEDWTLTFLGSSPLPAPPSLRLLPLQRFSLLPAATVPSGWWIHYSICIPVLPRPSVRQAASCAGRNRRCVHVHSRPVKASIPINPALARPSQAVARSSRMAKRGNRS